ncbi:hypothetical protein ACIRPX_43990 [Streptomyces sp. NPDC101225]|uniref:hypothetical protein n=1 Tax=Streptomyces sp. NPDC101225 TaxID=3366135 RepID=UPI0038071693
MATATEPDSAAQTAESAPADADEASLTAVLLDPDTIARDECNAREHDTEPDADLINSVKAVGVQDPVSVRPARTARTRATSTRRSARTRTAATPPSTT